MGEGEQEGRPLSIGSRSLSDKATPENAAKCIQIEVVGFVAKTPDLTPEQLAFVRDVMRQVEVQHLRLSGFIHRARGISRRIYQQDAGETAERAACI